MPAPQVLSRAEVFAVGCPTYVNVPVHEGDIPLHQHDFVEIALVRDGRGVHRTIHGLAPISRGDCFVILPGRWHAYERCRGLALTNGLFGADLLHRDLGWAARDPALASLLAGDNLGVTALRLADASLERCLVHLEAIRALVHGPAPLRTVFDQVGHLLLVLGELARQVDPHRAKGADHLGHPAVSEAIRLMEARLAHDWSLDELSRLLHLNRSYLVRLFRRRTGFTPIHWLARRRCEVAAVRLLTTTLPVAAIGAEVGWSDQNYFARRFRSLFKQTPSAYRRQLPTPAITDRQADAWIQW